MPLLARSQNTGFTDGHSSALTEYRFSSTKGFLRYHFSLPSSINTPVILIVSEDAVVSYLIWPNGTLIEKDILFDSPGNYRYKLVNENRLLDSGMITVFHAGVRPESFIISSIAEVQELNEVDYYQESASTMYYLRSRVYVTENPSETNQVEGLNIERSRSYAYIVVSNEGKALNTSSLISDVYMKKLGREKFLETVVHPADPNHHMAIFRYDFTRPGRYIFKVFNQKNTWINSTSVHVRFNKG